MDEQRPFAMDGWSQGLTWGVMGRMLSVFAHADRWDVLQLKIAVIAAGLFVVYGMLGLSSLRGRLYPGETAPTGKQISLFASGCIILYLSFGGPLDYLSDNYLFSVHMFQHMVEILFMTPLFVYGTPRWMTEPLYRWRPLSFVLRRWSHPVVSSLVFNLVLAFFHIPAIYDYSLNHENFHLFEHICFGASAIFLWLSRRPLTPGKQLLFLLLNYNLMMPLVIFMCIAQTPWYTFYVAQPRVFPWLTPLLDQQIGGFIMAGQMMGVYLFLAIRAFVRQDESIWYD